ncbi:MAG TPA: hypothetical protein VLU06_08605 [Thermoanaerobaculia bacterium]|nr:hypothetical protein [Thermoanaerobaculia bacterium]
MLAEPLVRRVQQEEAGQGRYFVEKTGGLFDLGRREFRVYPALAL